MGRKRRRRGSSDESPESESDCETIVVNSSQKYTLRPRRADQGILMQDLSEEDENQGQSDFEDELEGDTLITTVRHEADQEPPSHFYKTKEECIDNGSAVNEDEDLIDFESFIDKTEIQVHKRKVQNSGSPGTAGVQRKRRGRRPKWMMETERQQSEGTDEFFHFLDTRDSKVEDFVNITPVLDYASEIDGAAEIKQELNETADSIDNDHEGFGSVVEACQQNLVESDGPLGSVKDEPPENDDDAAVSLKNSPVFENDYNEDYDEEEPIDSVIDGTSEIKAEAKVVHSWSGITLAMDDKSCFVENDDEIAVLRNNSPKAKFHYLIIPKENLKSLNQVDSRHIETIEHMYNAAKRIISYPEHKNHNFLIGFDAMPTMIIYQEKFLWLHLHVISDEMNFDNIVSRKQWNAIHTSVFIHPQDVLAELREHGKMISLPTFDQCREMLDGEARCHKCGFVAKKFFFLKRHYANLHRVK